ncbi:hypothetical protein AGMMS49592_0320 [Endomicrobiia bacterium]|nr:hypothetical protein AGMMS49592_0320 [Endomicrobiia bacterium]
MRRLGLQLPSLGLNFKNGIADTPQGYALVMDNFYFEGSYIKVREGYQVIFQREDNIQKIYGCTNSQNNEQNRILFNSGTSLYKLTDVAIEAIKEDLPENANFVDLDFGNKKYFFSGISNPFSYDGTVCVDEDFTSQNPDLVFDKSTIEKAIVHQNRLYCKYGKSTQLWYSHTPDFPLKLDLFDVVALISKGGYIYDIASYSYSDASGSHVTLIVISNFGEVLVFQGEAPQDINNWLLIGHYYTSMPRQENNSLIPVRNDVFIFTSDNYVSLNVLSGMFNSPYSVAFNENMKNYLNNFIQMSLLGEYNNAMYYQQKDMIISNIRYNNDNSTQHIFSINNNAWTMFSGINAKNFATVSGELYFLNYSNEICKMFVGGKDDYNPQDASLGRFIKARFLTSYTNFGTDRLKMSKNVIILASHSARTNSRLIVRTDFGEDMYFDDEFRPYPLENFVGGDKWNENTWLDKDIGMVEDEGTMHWQQYPSWVDTAEEMLFSVGMRPYHFIAIGLEIENGLAHNNVYSLSSNVVISGNKNLN